MVNLSSPAFCVNSFQHSLLNSDEGALKTFYVGTNRVFSFSFSVNLFEFYNKVKRLGGHASVTSNKLWKSLYEDLGGELNYSASSTLARKHYEK